MARHDTTVCGAPCNARKECEAFSYGCNVMVANEGHGWSLSDRHVVGVGKSRRGDGEDTQYEGVRMQGACGKWSWQGTTPQCEGFDRALATGMWWALARAEEEMERAHNTESETWH